LEHNTLGISECNSALEVKDADSSSMDNKSENRDDLNVEDNKSENKDALNVKNNKSESKDAESSSNVKRHIYIRKVKLYKEEDMRKVKINITVINSKIFLGKNLRSKSVQSIYDITADENLSDTSIPESINEKVASLSTFSLLKEAERRTNIPNKRSEQDVPLSRFGIETQITIVNMNKTFRLND
jgi:hypothetical protein